MTIPSAKPLPALITIRSPALRLAEGCHSPWARAEAVLEMAPQPVRRCVVCERFSAPADVRAGADAAPVGVNPAGKADGEATKTTL